jgi:Sec-independent protein translocase protein TatA
MFNIGPLELFALVALGVLLFGRDLPTVGRKLGQTFAQFRRGLHEFKQHLERDTDLKDLKQSMQEIKRVAEMPRAIANPGRMLRDLTNEALATPADTPSQKPVNGTAAKPDASEEPPPA